MERKKLKVINENANLIKMDKVGISESTEHEDYDPFADSFDSNILNEIDTKLKQDDTNLKSQHHKENLNDMSLLFTDHAVTQTFKKHVDQLFEDIEQSICYMGPDNQNDSFADEIFGVFTFKDEEAKENVNLDDTRIQQGLNKTSDMNCSLGSLLKKALVKNAGNNVQLSQKSVINYDVTLNRSLINESEFRNLGDFFGLPDTVKQLIKHYKGIENLYDWQKECLDLAVSNRSNLIYALPTSGGKTLVAEILMLREILCYQKNVIFVLPFVAIVQEKVWDMSPFAVALDFLVEEYASSKGTYPPKKRRRKHSVYIATVEKALGLVNSLIETGRLNEIGLIVIDELHFIGDESRGATLEICLTKIAHLNENIQIVGMSATVGNINDLAKFLNAQVYSKNFRPVELNEYVKCDNEIAQINWNHKYDEINLLVDARKLDFKYSEELLKLDPDMLGGLVLQVIPKDSCLVFCPSKKNCENVALLLSRLTKKNLLDHKKSEKTDLIKAISQETGEICKILKTTIPFGIAYHHSGLTNEERKLLEESFRGGIISVICCTSTLAAGVNLPARRVVLRSPYVGRDFITLSTYKQMVGRAGRAGFGEIGESIIVTTKDELPKIKKLLLSPMNQAVSKLHNNNATGLRHLLLSCISLGSASTKAELQKVVEKTLMVVQAESLGLNIKSLTNKAIKELFKMCALKKVGWSEDNQSLQSMNVSVHMDDSVSSQISLSSINGDKPAKPKITLVLDSNTKLLVSKLGTAAIKGGLELTRSHQLYEDLYAAQKALVLLNGLHLLYLVTPYNTSERVNPDLLVYHQVLTNLKETERLTAERLGFDESVVCRLAMGSIPKKIPDSVFNRFYVTLMLHDLWNEIPVFEVSQKYQIDRGIVQNLMTTAATFASSVVNFCEQLEEFWAFAHLLKGMSARLAHCCMRELIPLMELPAVKQSRARQLYLAGYKNLQSVAKANVDDLMQIEFMTRKVANQLIAAAKMLLLEKVENLREEAEDVLEGIAPDN